MRPSNVNTMLGNLEAHHSTITLRCFPGIRAMSSGMNSALTAVRMFFPRLSNSSMNFRISSFGFASQICIGSRSSVSPMLHRNRYMSVFVREKGSDFIFLRFVMIRFKIIEDRVRVSSRFLFWQNVLCFLVFALPFLDK